MATSVADIPRLEVAGLVKRFREKTAVDRLDLTIAPGELVGLIGPNGAGKSTTVKVITGQLLGDEGTIRVGGHDIRFDPLAARRLTGYVPQDVVLYPFLTGREVLQFVAEVHGLEPNVARPRIDELLARFALTPAQNRMTREYSEGMARKLAIAVALVGEPELLVLDESLNGLDPRAAAEVKQIIRDRMAAGTAILWVSHMLEVVASLASRVVVMDSGRLVGELSREAMDERAARGETLEDFFLAHTTDTGS